MSDDLRTRYAEALCANDGLDRSVIGYGALWGGYLEAADAVLSVRDEECYMLHSQLASSKAAHEAVWQQHQERGAWIFRLQEEKADLRDRAENAEKERDEHREAAEVAEAKLRKIEHGCETPESHNYGCPCDELATLREAYEKARADAERYKRAYEMKPATMRLEGPGVERLVWHTTAGARDWESSDVVTPTLAEEIASAAPLGSLVNDLRATIVSQAREIARLKGESA
ncbi:hypothetical protein OG912_32215 [Streptomyces sp. NBC_00464]|uniref:hypothetical protein n=1 Tax=Streptomyces sp. NBC_00464 TaxID=2975751 RepID=UPI002E19B48E